ncbi:NADH:flavin oxidoreductase/NADH oxidase [Xylaria digitata]|nr:NADH:flavin oxidoreductase/NADH oxidase [Xylaria digitata]
MKAPREQKQNATPVLSQPLTLKCGLTLPNRLVKAAMAECMADGYGIPSGWGMLITGNVQVDLKYLGTPGDIALDFNVDSKQALQKWTSWAGACQRYGTPTVVQICHPGRQSPLGAGNRSVFEKNIVPSAIGLNFGPGFIPRFITSVIFGVPKAMSIGDIQDIIDRFVKTARLAAEAGFSGVEIHAAHGYLLAQFLSAKSNQRTDDYGGSPAARAKIVIEIIEAIRDSVPKSFCIGIKLNSADHQSPEEFESCLEQITLVAAAGVDFLEISGGTYENPTMSLGVAADATKPASTKAREAFFLEFAEAIRQKVLHLPLIVTGGFRSRHGMETALEQNACDLIGIGRPAVMNPTVPKKLFLNQEVADSDATIKVHRVSPSWWMKKIGVKALGAGAENTWYKKKIQGMRKA